MQIKIIQFLSFIQFDKKSTSPPPPWEKYHSPEPFPFSTLLFLSPRPWTDLHHRATPFHLQCSVNNGRWCEFSWIWVRLKDLATLEKKWSWLVTRQVDQGPTGLGVYWWQGHPSSSIVAREALVHTPESEEEKFYFMSCRMVRARWRNCLCLTRQLFPPAALGLPHQPNQKGFSHFPLLSLTEL